MGSAASSSTTAPCTAGKAGPPERSAPRRRASRGRRAATRAIRILGKLADEKEERFPLKLEGDGYHYDGPSFSAKIAMDGRVTFDEHSIRDFKGLSGGFDLTDIAMRNHHQDPYRYEKERFMENTNKLRSELTTKARRDRLESSLAALPGHLDSVWNDPNHSAHERRGVLFAMWREAAAATMKWARRGRRRGRRSRRSFASGCRPGRRTRSATRS